MIYSATTSRHQQIGKSAFFNLSLTGDGRGGVIAEYLRSYRVLDDLCQSPVWARPRAGFDRMRRCLVSFSIAQPSARQLEFIGRPFRMDPRRGRTTFV